jgi:hypothetical protein
VISDAPLSQEIPDGAATRDLRQAHAAQFITAGDELLLVLGYVGGLAVHRVRGGASDATDVVTTLQTLVLDSDLLAMVSQLRLVAAEEFAIIATRRFEQQGLTLRRVQTGETLALGAVVELGLPPEVQQIGGFSLALGPGALILAAAGADDDGQRDIFATRLDPASFAVRDPWRRLSAPDDISSYGPRVTASGDHFLVTWRDARLGGPLARTRCLGDDPFLSK